MGWTFIRYGFFLVVRAGIFLYLILESYSSTARTSPPLPSLSHSSITPPLSRSQPLVSQPTTHTIFNSTSITIIKNSTRPP